MGKKVKKDDKGPPEDVFDPLLVESRQAATVVLMLESPEDEVQSKATEAIYKFVDKCEENKKLLLDLGTVDSLLRLLSSEEKVVRRNAMMALGSMTYHPDTRKYLRKRDDSVPLILKLLNPEEFVTTLEFGTLCLANLANEYTSIASILDHNGMEPLVECLKSDDPDVQKNTIECISLLLMDFEARSILKDCNGLEPMLELLKSEFAVIQELALQAFIRATQDASNRAALREMEALREFVEMVGKPECNDLHVHALHVLANCLDDVESLQQLRECAGLARLVAFITDAQPPEEEAKQEKGKKAKSAKKKKDDDGKGKDDEKVPSNTLPEVKMHACRAIMRAARNVDNRRIFHEVEVEKMLIHLLSHDEEFVRVAAAQAIAVMAESSVSQDAIAKFEGIDPLIKMVKNDHKEPKEAGTLAIANITMSNPNNCQDVASHHGTEHLISCLSVDQERICANALIALTNMSTEDALRNKILHQGFISALIGPLKSASTMVQTNAAMAVAAFLCDSHSKAELRDLGGLEPLLSLLYANDADVRRAACWAVTVLGSDEEIAQDMYRLGALEVLQEINSSETKRNKFSDAALQKIYDNNLTAKYALTGYLDFTDHIPDEFFDPGQLRPDGKLLSIIEYGQEKLNHRRPIILINTNPIKTDQAIPQSAEQESKAESGGKSSGKRKGLHVRYKSPKTRNRDRERTATSEEDAPTAASGAQDGEGEAGGSAPEQTVYAPPDDPTLLRYIDEVRQNVMSMANITDQVSFIGNYVAMKMGGAIEKGQLMNFSWELPLSQLKFNLKTNVIPLGLIATGIHSHRALLFKLLADRVGLSTNLIRGEYNRGWNEVWLAQEPGLPPSKYIVDLIHSPGSLLRSDSIDATNYVKL